MKAHFSKAHVEKVDGPNIWTDGGRVTSGYIVGKKKVTRAYVNHAPSQTSERAIRFGSPDLSSMYHHEIIQEKTMLKISNAAVRVLVLTGKPHLRLEIDVKFQAAG